jgi:p-cumate 2,3-dioxygenase alpha subunit
MKCNWKLLVENSIDGYHLIPTHNTYLEYLAGLGTQPSTNRRWSRTLALGNGHSVLSSEALNGKPVASWAPLYGEHTKQEFADKRQRLVDRFGEDKAWLIANATRNLHIYPNLIINDVAGTTVRSFWPVAPDHLEVSAWEVVPREEEGTALARRLDSFLTFLGPGGFATPDDVEALESCQEGFLANQVEWSDISRGMHETTPKGIHELQMRSFWRRWHADMTGQRRFDTGDRVPAREEPVLASDDD